MSAKPNMIWKIARKEFLLNIMTFKFAVGTILCMVLMVFFVPILVKDYEQRLQKYNKLVSDNEAELLKVRVYKNITPTIYRPPAMLSIFSTGLEKRLDDSARIELENIPVIEAAPTGDNHYLSIFPILDASLILKIVLSLLAILIAYDRISGEKERGTLRLILTNSTARYEVLLGKLLAGIVTLLAPATIAFVVGLLVIELSPMTRLAGSDWIRVGLMYITSLIFIIAMYNIGLLFSCLANHPAISLILGLFFWVLCVAVIPNAGIYIATRIKPLESREKADSQIRALRTEYEDQYWRIRGAAGRGLSTSQSDTSGAFGNGYTKRWNSGFFKMQQGLHPNAIPLKLEYADKIWGAQSSYLKNVWQQRKLANTLSRISPIFSYENAMSILAGTDISSFQSFASGAKAYRNQIVEYIRAGTDNFRSPSYWTPFNIEYASDYGEGRKEVPDLAQHPRLNLQDVPPCGYQLDLSESIRQALPDMALLAFASVFFFTLSFVAFMKGDVR